MSMITTNSGMYLNIYPTYRCIQRVILFYFFFCLEFSHRCPKCDFCTKSEPEWKLHLKEDHNLTPEDLDDDQGIRAPKINSQGKVKVFKCKQVRNLL